MVGKPNRVSCPKCGSTDFTPIEGSPGAMDIKCASCGTPLDRQLLPSFGTVSANYYALASHQEHAAALGSLVAAWSCVEGALSNVMSAVLRSTPWQGQAAYYALASFNARIGVLSALSDTMAMDLEGKFRTRLVKLIEDVRALSLKRNDYVHDRWVIGADGKGVYQVRNEGNLTQMQPQQIRVQELREASAKLMNMTAELQKFAADYSSVYPMPIPFDEDQLPVALRKKFAEVRATVEAARSQVSPQRDPQA